MNTPLIRTKRLWLDSVSLDDVADIFEYAKNPNMLRYTTAKPPQQISETEDYVKGLLDAPDGSYAWALRLAQGGSVIGIVELGQYDGSCASVDYGLSEEFWNQGLMTEAVQAIVNWGFCHIAELETVTSGAMTANPASTSVQQKCGMTVQSVELQNWAKFDQPVEVAICSITREAWSNNPNYNKLCTKT